MVPKFSSRARAEAAALIALSSSFAVSLAAPPPKPVCLDWVERLIECCEAYQAYVPDTQMDLESLLVLQRSLVAGKVMLGKCPHRYCHTPILIDRYAGRNQCGYCKPPRMPHRTSGEEQSPIEPA